MTGTGEGEVEDTYGRDLPWRKVSAFVTRIILKHPFLLAAVVVASLGVVAAELLSLSLLIPFLTALTGTSSGAFDGYALNFLQPYFEGLTPVETVRAVAVGLVVVTLVRGVFSYVESRVSAYMRIILERDLRQQVFDELVHVELQFIHKETSANLFTILHTYPRQAAALADEYLGMLSKGMTFVAYAAVLLMTSWQLTLLALALGGLSTFLVGRMRIFIKRLGRRINRSRVRLHQVSLESLHAAKVIRLYAREDYAQRRFLHEVKTLQRDSYKSASLGAAMPPLQRLLNMGLLATLLITATYVLSTSGPDWIVMLTLFIAIMMRITGPMGDYAKRQTRIATQMPALEAIIDFMERPDKRRLPSGSRAFERLREGVRFESVSYAYGDGPKVVHDVSFTIPRGGTVALVGASGSGKSTLINLLARLADPVEGRILVDGKDVRELEVRSWRRRIAVVSQDTFLFNDTVRENIRFGRLEATDAEVEEAARLANAHEFIAQMEDGYDTRVGDRGVRLSGGQAQRLAIARALLADPDILVLDEATSALDAGTERLVQEAIERVSRDRTVIAVAHRLSTIRRADEILVLEGGRIVERGTHDVLMAQGGQYARYVGMQTFHDDTETVRVPVQGPPPSLRVVLHGSPTHGRLMRGDEVLHGEMPLQLLAGAQAPLALAESMETDGIVLWSGSDVALVRLDGRLHEAVPIYQTHADDATLKRVRVREIVLPSA